MLSRLYSRTVRMAICGYAILPLVLATGCATKSVTSSVGQPSKPTTYVFGWLDYPIDEKPIRGGTTKGAPVRLDTIPSQTWAALQTPGLAKMERDQAAIRALAGDYRASFDFLETLVFAPHREPSQPYRSWGTERVYVVEDRPGFVELQHVMVMFIVDGEGEIQGPMVMKHWRQRWEFEPATLQAYAGHRIWENRTIADEDRTGKWVQTVYQVDDTPRYALIGAWQHHATHSQWTSVAGYRPLPRREYAVRDDYHVLDGTNRITVLPDGWVHEQDNLKRMLGSGGRPPGARPFVARELGLNRYQRLAGFDFSAGDDYWRQTAPYWAVVRQQLDARMRESDRMRVESECDGQSAFMIFFEQASAYQAGEYSEPSTVQEQIETVLDCLISAPNPH